MNATEFNGTFWLSIAGMLVGVTWVVLGAINKSKCSNIKCCFGLIGCIRDTAKEAEIEEHRMDLRLPESPAANAV